MKERWLHSWQISVPRPLPWFLCLFIGAGQVRADVFDDLGFEKEDVAAVRTLADELVKQGFPDGSAAEFFVGEIIVRSTVDPATEKPPFPVKNSFMQSTAPGGQAMEYGYKFPGFHARLKDGSWILRMNFRFHPDKKNRIGTADARQVGPTAIHAEALKQNPTDMRRDAEGWIAGFPEAERERFTDILDQAAPILTYLNCNADFAPPALVLLHRAGMKEAPLLAFVMADLRSRQYWQLRYWDDDPGPFDPSGVYPAMQSLEAEWREAKNGTYAMERLDTAFRRSIHRLVRHSLMSEEPLFEPETAARLAKATLDPGDPQGIGRSIDRMLAGSRLSDTPGKNAGLKEKLAAWGRPKEPEMVVNQGGAKGKAGSLSISTQFRIPVSAYTPAQEDLGELFSLVDDNSPSKWSDFQGGRTLGENAMRAIAIIMKRNPLELVGMDGTEPWTEERRKIAAGKLRSWWASHEGDHQQFFGKEE